MSLFGWSLPAGCDTLPGEEPEPICCYDCDKEECPEKPEENCPELLKEIREMKEEDRKVADAQYRDLIEAKKLETPEGK